MLITKLLIHVIIQVNIINTLETTVYKCRNFIWKPVLNSNKKQKKNLDFLHGIAWQQ